MNKASPHAGDHLPKARTKRRAWDFPFIWVVPILSALVAGYLVYHHVREFGSTITIRFRTASGLEPGQTTMRYRGADIGQVAAVTLSQDQQYATVNVRLRRSASSVAREGSVFWIVRPEVGLGNLTGLETIVTGPYIEVLPGKGRTTTEFTGVESSPLDLDPHGLTVVLLSNDAGSLRAGVPIYYRGIEVGAVRETRLETNATAVEIVGVIRQRYAGLVRAGSKFWNVTGLDLRLGLFHGAEMNVESLKSLLIGGIAFATPDVAGSKPVEHGMYFRLYTQPEKEWQTWAPRIPIPPDETEIHNPVPESRPSLPFPTANDAGS
jgi:paraquat-inducible protein B